MYKVNQTNFEGLVEGQRMHMHDFVTNELANPNSNFSNLVESRKNGEGTQTKGSSLSNQSLHNQRTCQCPGVKATPLQICCQECGQKMVPAPIFSNTLFHDNSILDRKGNISNHALRLRIFNPTR
jgi:hypothetical protein